MCNHFNTLCFVGKKKRSLKIFIVCVHSVDFANSSAKETIVTKTPSVSPALALLALIPIKHSHDDQTVQSKGLTEICLVKHLIV